MARMIPGMVKAGGNERRTTTGFGIWPSEIFARIWKRHLRGEKVFGLFSGVLNAFALFSRNMLRNFLISFSTKRRSTGSCKSKVHYST